MPLFLGLPAGSNPLAVAHGQTPVLNLRNYEFLIQWSIDRASPLEFANLTTLTQQTVLGTKVAQHLGYGSTGSLRLYICNPAGLNLPAERHPVDVNPVVSPSVDPDYFQLGWEVMEQFFHLTEVRNTATCVLTARNRNECRP
jgi:hypothetical protein